MPKPKFHQSISIALKGIAHGFSRERNIKVQMVIGWLVVMLSIFLQIPRNDLILIVMMCFLVIVLELINTSFEKLIDFLHPDKHDEIRKIKDMMAGAVLLVVIMAVIIGVLILYRPLLNVFGLIR
ncbi:diacylglycerol kinase family protein [Candidatus Woesearchaeota archaeon]|nr:diacylglycerol kinase family protein [Candidatus Woesearchaeota archaeon]